MKITIIFAKVLAKSENAKSERPFYALYTKAEDTVDTWLHPY
jgi:hypothetical protein